MKYADGPTVEVSVDVAAEPDALWPLITDIELPARFSGELMGAKWIDPDVAPGLGARFVGRNQHPYVGEWETTSTVVASEPGRVFSWAVSDPDTPAATWKFELTPAGEGTRLTQWVRLGPGPSGLTPAIESMPDREDDIIARRLAEHRENMTATLEGIKALAEAG